MMKKMFRKIKYYYTHRYCVYLNDTFLPVVSKRMKQRKNPLFCGTKKEANEYKNKIYYSCLKRKYC